MLVQPMKTVKQILASVTMLFVTMGTLPLSAQTLDEAVAAYELGDFATALRGFRSYAEQGYADAQFILGAMYVNGEGVPEDTVHAYAWGSIAAAQGNTSAKRLKELVTRQMARSQIAEAQKLSRKYWALYVLPFQ